MMTLQEQLTELANLRQELNARLVCKRERQEELEATPEYIKLKDITDAIDKLKTSEAVLTGRIKEGVVKDLPPFVEEGINRHPASGVEIKEFSMLEVNDEKAAKEWAATNAPDTLKLNTDSLMKIVKAGVKVGWGKVIKIYKAQIATDLSEYLKEKESSNG